MNSKTFTKFKPIFNLKTSPFFDSFISKEECNNIFEEECENFVQEEYNKWISLHNPNPNYDYTYELFRTDKLNYLSFCSSMINLSCNEFMDNLKLHNCNIVENLKLKMVYTNEEINCLNLFICILLSLNKPFRICNLNYLYLTYKNKLKNEVILRITQKLKKQIENQNDLVKKIITNSDMLTDEEKLSLMKSVNDCDEKITQQLNSLNSTDKIINNACKLMLNKNVKTQKLLYGNFLIKLIDEIIPKI